MKQLSKKGIVFILALAMLVTGFGCGASKTVKGGAIGAAAGGAIGAAVGSRAGKTVVGAIIGAAVGGTAGALIGRYMDKQAEEMQRDLENAKVERVGEGIKITFQSGILFDVDKSDLRPEAKTEIERLAKILQKYKDTNILVEGHTDSDGTEEYNQSLSERRARSVASFAEQFGVTSSRFNTVGYGETQPVVENTSSANKQQNRRVEMAVMANEDLKEAAEEGKLKM